MRAREWAIAAEYGDMEDYGILPAPCAPSKEYAEASTDHEDTEWIDCDNPVKVRR